MGQTFKEIAQVPNLFIVDPAAAIASMYPEIFETLKRLFGADARAMKHYLLKDFNQLPVAEI